MKHVAAVTNEEPLAPLWQKRGAFESLDDEPFFTQALQDAPADVIAWHYFCESVNNGLAGVRARLTPPSIEGCPDASNVRTSYEAACILIYNDLFSGMPYQRCADETCGRLFKIQIGRAEQGCISNQGRPILLASSRSKPTAT